MVHFRGSFVSNLVHFPILLWMMTGDLLFARMYACNTKALKTDLESEVRTIRDSDCGLSSALFRCGIQGGRWWSRLPGGHASRSRAWVGRRPPDSSFGSLCLCVLSWQEGVGSRRAAELEILICNWQGQPAVPTGSPSLHAKPQKTLAAGLCYLITFWRLIQWSGSIAYQGWGLIGALGFAFPEEAGMDPRKNYWRGNSVTLAPAF